MRTDASDIRILVYRAGRLANLGHNHVVSAGTVSGSVYLHSELTRSSFELEIPVAELTVDDPALRAEEGEAFASTPSDADVEATRRNLLGEQVLDATRHPIVTLRGGLQRDATGFRAQGVLIVRDRQVPIDVPIELERGQRSLRVRGSLTLTHEALGLTPFSALLGALRVAEQLELEFSIGAERAAPMS